MRKITRNSVVAGTILLSTLALAACGETKSADSSSTPATSSSMDKMEKDDKMEMDKMEKDDKMEMEKDKN